jgi:release factor glutamine methyltransferase
MTTELSLRSILSQTRLPPNEARILLAYILDKHYQLPRSAIHSKDELEINSTAFSEWQALEVKRLAGHPIAYLVGKKGFHNIELAVGPGVLIPRPETELLVEIGLHQIGLLKKTGAIPKILDLGTGSGAIALAIANVDPTLDVTATDQSAEALAIAQNNANLLGLTARVHFAQGNWYEALNPQECFDIILSNPPYITHQDPHLLQGDLRFEPLSALTDQADGLSCLQSIISGAPSYLAPKGFIAVEHGFDQSHAVIELMKLAGFSEIQAHQDLAGHPRVVSARK